MNSQEALDSLAEDKELKGATFRVLFKVCARVDYENWVHLPLKELSDELGIGKSHISENIKLLVEKGILLKGKKMGRSYTYRLNPDFGWKGKVKNLDSYRRQRDEEDLNKERKRLQRRAAKKIQAKKRKTFTDEVIALLESEEVDLEKLSQFIKQQRETKCNK